MKIADLRQEYMRAGLGEADADRDPIRQFERWFEDALRARLPLPNAMTLATVSAQGAPSARLVLLKGIENGGFTFYTNYRSRKARELEARGRACLVFLWSPLERQVRVDGTIERVSAEESDVYFASRPRDSQIAAWAAPQSSELPHRAALETRYAELSVKYEGQRVPRPPDWGGYRVVPNRVEFWQGRPKRLHDRLVYVKDEHGWTRTRLAP